jgi:hypothetical protein
MTTPRSLGPYFAGLWEGDGHLWIPKTTHAPSGKQYTPHLAITLNKNDYPLVVMLRLLIGGTIRHKVENNAYVLTVTSISGLLNMVSLMSGYLRTPKINRFNNIIRWLNEHGSTLELSVLDTSQVFSNAWLSGFWDADGSFDLRVREIAKGATKNRVEARARLEQRMSDTETGSSYEPILTAIATVMTAALNTTLHKGVTYYIIAVTSPAKLVLLSNYLKQYPLWSSKLMNYRDFYTCLSIMLKKQHLTDEARAEIKLLRDGLNSTRTQFNWDHLKQLESY